MLCNFEDTPPSVEAKRGTCKAESFYLILKKKRDEMIDFSACNITSNIR